jgi:hypothetical protein
MTGKINLNLDQSNLGKIGLFFITNWYKKTLLRQQGKLIIINKKGIYC